MSNMYGPRRIVFHNTGIIAICGTHEGATGGSWCAMGRYVTDSNGRTEVYMVDDPFKSRDHQLILIGCADTRLEAKRMIFKACKDNPGHIFIYKDEYVDDKGKVYKGRA